MRLINVDRIRWHRCLVQNNDGSYRAENVAYESEVNHLPPVTPEPKRGRWIKYEDRAGWYCSECATDDYYAYFLNSDTGVYELQDKFCPNCGADMRGEKRVND